MKDGIGKTALKHATEKNFAEIVAELKKQGARS
jgi:hypothetical protein